MYSVCTVVRVLYRTQREIDGKRESRRRATVPPSELGKANVESRKMQYTCVICLQTHALNCTTMHAISMRKTGAGNQGRALACTKANGEVLQPD